MPKIYDGKMGQVENPNGFQIYIRDNPCYWNKTGKYQEAVDKIQALIPASGGLALVLPNVEIMRIALNGYYDYFNNGGCNRKIRLKPMCERLVFAKGSTASKAVSKLRRYKNVEFGCLPANLEWCYDAIIDRVIEDFFPEYIEVSENA